MTFQPDNEPARFGDDDLTDDGFLGGRLRVWQPVRGYRAATDPVFLAAAVAAVAGQSVLELGCGAGVASLCLATRVPGLALTGVELQPAYADLAQRNAARNGVGLTVVVADITALPAAQRVAFDHVIANPPYYPKGGGTPATDQGRETALREATPMSAWADAAARRLAPGGWFWAIQQASRLPDLLGGLGPRLGSVSVLPLAPRIGQPASRVIVRARKGGRAAFRLLAPLVVHEGPAHERDGDSFTPLARSVLRDGQGISALFN
jgi:tRNA1Val (adenine37-N6)-methyltransferase